MRPPLRLALFSEVDIRDAARAVVRDSRTRMNRVLDYAHEGDADLATDNPYVRLLLDLYRFARKGGAAEADNAETQLTVARSVLADPLYAHPDPDSAGGLISLVFAGANARLRMLRGETLDPAEHALLEDV